MPSGSAFCTLSGGSSGLTYDEAMTACQGEGGSLASITDADVNSFIDDNLLTTSGEPYWIGLRATGTSFIWEDGSTYSYNAFSFTRSFTSGDCGCIWHPTDSGSWMTQSCTERIWSRSYPMNCICKRILAGETTDKTPDITTEFPFAPATSGGPTTQSEVTASGLETTEADAETTVFTTEDATTTKAVTTETTKADVVTTDFTTEAATTTEAVTTEGATTEAVITTEFTTEVATTTKTVTTEAETTEIEVTTEAATTTETFTKEPTPDTESEVTYAKNIETTNEITTELPNETSSEMAENVTPEVKIAQTSTTFDLKTTVGLEKNTTSKNSSGQEIDCGSVPVIPKTTSASDGTTVGSVAEYTCALGLSYSSGTNVSICQADGTWQPVSIMCKDQKKSVTSKYACSTCGDPPIIANTSFYMTVCGEAARYTCLPGYVKVWGSEDKFCDSTTGWVGEDLRCEKSEVEQKVEIFVPKEVLTDDEKFYASIGWTSADSRTSAVVTGSVFGITFIATISTMFILLDVLTLKRHIQLCKSNVKNKPLLP